MTKPPSVMTTLIEAMRHGDGHVYRRPGGAWYTNRRGNGTSYLEKTVMAIVKRGDAAITDWYPGSHRAFAIRATLKAQGEATP